MKILVTGGAGYIGSHFVKYLCSLGYDVVVFDNLSRGNKKALPEQAEFRKVELRDYDQVYRELQSFGNIEVIVHFAAFAYVGESVQNPEMYYENNVIGSFNLIKASVASGIKKTVFSSTCSLYGNPTQIPISETEFLKPINPYARTKMMIENLLQDFDIAYGLKSVALRYFNAAGADFEGEIGESHDPEPHLIPLVLFTALGKRDKILVYGDDYDTEDGTCVRDYIHINDLADAHLKAIEFLLNNNRSEIINLGTGNGYSVMEIINKTKEITGKNFQVEVVKRRPGDPAKLIADNKKASSLLNWSPKYGLTEIIESAYNWHKNQKF